MFHEVDENSDGRINFEEYRALMLQHPSVLRQMKETSASSEYPYTQEELLATAGNGPGTHFETESMYAQQASASQQMPMNQTLLLHQQQMMMDQ